MSAKQTYVAAIFGKHPKVKVALAGPQIVRDRWLHLVESGRRFPVMAGGDERHIRRAFNSLYVQGIDQ